MGLRDGLGFNDFDPGLILRAAKYSAEIFTSSSVTLFAFSTIIGGGTIFGSEVFLRLFL